jgi:hypothetical protein
VIFRPVHQYARILVLDTTTAAVRGSLLRLGPEGGSVSHKRFEICRALPLGIDSMRWVSDPKRPICPGLAAMSPARHLRRQQRLPAVASVDRVPVRNPERERCNDPR